MSETRASYVTPLAFAACAGQMNKTETRYERDVLRPLRLAGEIARYSYEAITLTLAHNVTGKRNGTTYTPDFFVVWPDHMEFKEVKARRGNWSSMRDDALVKLKIAAEQFPMFKFTLVEYERGQWNETEY